MTITAQPKDTPSIDSRESLIFGIYDRLGEHGHCTADVVIAPAKENGEPDWENTGPANLSALLGDQWPEDVAEANRACVIVSDIDGCDPDSTFIVIVHPETGVPGMFQIHGPDIDRDVADSIVGRDLGNRPPKKEQTRLQAAAEKLMDDLKTPVAANDNKPDFDDRLVPFLEAYGGNIRSTTLFGAVVDNAAGQIWFGTNGALFFSARTGVRHIDLPPKPKDRFTFDWFGDLDEDMPKEEIVKGAFGVDEFTMISGKPGSGKSVITTDLACHVAAGMPWHGRPVKQGLVIYIAAERKALTKRRMRAFRKHHGIDEIPLAVLGGMLDLTSGLADANAIIQMVKAAEEYSGQKCVWVIVDTLTRVFGPGDQNTSKDMTKFVQACDTIREGITGTHLTVIHHTGWAGDRGKGAIDLDGAVDASFLVKKEAAGYILECDGTNDGDEGVIARFRMQGVQVGEKDGEPTMAPVVVPADAVTAGEQLVANVKGHKAKALEVIRKLAAEGKTAPQGLWRSAFYAEYPGIDTNTLKSRFKRAKDSLVDDGLVIEADGCFGVSEADT
ncbi:MAG: AAA family ATPase [Agrobacterium cavarae]